MAPTAPTELAAGVLLAAGAGTRYGMPKVLAEGGQWLQRAVTALHAGGCADVIVVLGAAVVEVPAPARAGVAADWGEGLSASLRAGIAAAETTSARYAVLHTVDTPDIDETVIDRVLTEARAAPHGIARARYGSRPGHPVVVARRHWAELVADTNGGEGGRAFLRRRGAEVVDVDCSDLAHGHDVDFPPASAQKSSK
jgi:CTP:molybdopterin cytidylyltransferase MocA